ncbi:hypothetical protein PRO82_000604 [Candidatus Protochlamydia amoebophila]|nr:hypothetical protein [Candidatus Protochlamydia amoebophila]
MLENKPSISLINFMFIGKPFLGVNINLLASHLVRQATLINSLCFQT